MEKIDFSQYIGFIVSLLAIAFLIFQKVREELYKRNHPKEYAERKRQKEEHLREFMKSLEVNDDENQERAEIQARIERARQREQIERGRALAQQGMGLRPKTVPPAPAPKPPKPPKTHPLVADNFTFKSKLDDYHQKSTIEERRFKTSIEERYADPFGDRVTSIDLGKRQAAGSYEVINKDTESRGSRLLASIPSNREMVILYEVFGPPKGLR